jgi:H+-transporting ATPase
MTSESCAGKSGLTTLEAAWRLQRYGPNAVAEERRHPGRALLSKLWAPVPWMLEVVIALQVRLGQHIEAGVIAVLLVFNAVLGFLQENRASNAKRREEGQMVLGCKVRARHGANGSLSTHRWR